jgi:hypothetical protein
VTQTSLASTILQYQLALSTYHAAADQLEARGETVDLQKAYEPFMHALEAWDRPAESVEDAVLALQLASEDYDMGDTPRIPAMIKAALGWLQGDQERRCESRGPKRDFIGLVDQLNAAISLNSALIMASTGDGVTREAGDALSSLGCVVEDKLLDLKRDMEEAMENDHAE